MHRAVDKQLALLSGTMCAMPTEVLNDPPKGNLMKGYAYQFEGKIIVVMSEDFEEAIKKLEAKQTPVDRDRVITLTEKITLEIAIPKNTHVHTEVQEGAKVLWDHLK